MYNKERINKFRNMVENCKEIDKRIIDIKVTMHDLEKLSYNEDIKFLEEMQRQLDKFNIEFYNLKKKITTKVLDTKKQWYNISVIRKTGGNLMNKLKNMFAFTSTNADISDSVAYKCLESAEKGDIRDFKRLYKQTRKSIR